MADDVPAGHSRITPYLGYEDGEAAIEFLVKAFGFTEQFRMQMPDGSIGHAELELDGGHLMLGCPGPDYRSPKHQGRDSDVLVYVICRRRRRPLRTGQGRGCDDPRGARRIRSTATAATPPSTPRAIAG